MESSAQCALGVRLGGEIALAVPQPLSMGAEAYCLGDQGLCSEKVRYYVNSGYFQWPPAGGDRTLGEYTIEMGTRIFPFRAPLYVSAGLGYRHIFFAANMASFTIEGETLATHATLNLGTFYLSPTLGWSISLSRVLLLSFELGVQMPLIASGNLFLENRDTGDHSNNSPVLRTDSESALQRLAAYWIPKVTLIRLTWYLD